jgi:hypothetical protein
MRPHVVLLALAGVFLPALAGCQRGQTNSYASYAEADKAGAIDRGWVPEFLPRDASNITESHDVDVGRIAIAFDAQENAFLAQFAALPRDQGSGAAEIAARTALAKEVRGISAAYYYRCAESGMGLLVHPVGTTRYLYSEPMADRRFDGLCDEFR